MQANNVQYVQMRSKGDGLFMYINGTPLPNITWDKQMLANAVDVYAQLNPGVPENYLSLIRQFAPLLGSADVSVLVHFPLAPDAKTIPVKMQ